MSKPAARFYYLMDLHYSQTRGNISILYNYFTTLWIYTILKPQVATISENDYFTTLWIYTILKPVIDPKGII